MSVANIEDHLLTRLCELLGIGGDYHDCFGQYHTVSPEIKAALIAAMGCSVADNHAAQALIQRLENQTWHELLPPVVVLREASEIAIEINLTEDKIATNAVWQLQLEDGTIIEHHFLPQEQQYLSEQWVDNQRYLRYRVTLPQPLPLGYHHLTMRLEQAQALCQLIVAPNRCYQPEQMVQGKRLAGFGVQLYALRSERNWGIGDFTDLQELITASAQLGLDFIGVNPLHALYPDNPQHHSPYSPSSRLFINYLYIDITATADYQESDAIKAEITAAEFQAKLAALRQTDWVDYSAVADLKLPILKKLYAHFCATHSVKRTARAAEFNAYLEQGGESLQRQAMYDALYAHFIADQQIGWSQWPVEYRDPNSDAVRQFCRENRHQVEFYQYLQWLADQQLANAQQIAVEQGMVLGLYRDLAVGVDSGGAEAWSEQYSYSFQASVGAPPDPIALQGQDWGLPPLNPHRLRASAYAAFIELMRANMRHCGALRIDHVMALFRLWWVVAGQSALHGAYVYYPLQDLLGILALESQRNHCLIIGEDLGTVPDQIRESLPEANVYSYKVAYFEKTWENRFKLPQDYEPQAIATVTTHDLPTLAAWWEGRDLQLRDELAIFPSTEVREREYAARCHDRLALLSALRTTGNLANENSTAFQAEAIQESSFNSVHIWSLISAVHLQLAQSQSALLCIQLEDMFTMREPVNVPGTVGEYPNWRRKLSQNTAAAFADSGVITLLQSIINNRAC